MAGRAIPAAVRETPATVLRRLREAAAKYPVSVLDCMVTCKHVQLLLWGERAAHVSEAMRYLSGAAAQDYNRRKRREVLSGGGVSARR